MRISMPEKQKWTNTVCCPLVPLLKDCAQRKDLCEGIRLHAEILKTDFILEKDSYVASALVTMYAKCGALLQAQQLLDKLPVPNVVAWSALISGYTEQGQGKRALECYEQMLRDGTSPDIITFICVLKACGSIGAVDKGEQIYTEIVDHGLLQQSVVLGNAVVDMYGKCGALAKASEVLDQLPLRDVVSWNALIAGYAQKGKVEEALHCVKRMELEDLSADVVTLVSILKACGSTGAFDIGIQIHYNIVSQGLLRKHMFLGNVLVDMYAKCGMLGRSQEVLDGLPVRDAVSWSALVAGYANWEQAEEALNCFEQMLLEGLSLDAITFISILKACGSIGAAEKGKQIHDEIAVQGLLGKDIALSNALLDMYIKCGMLVEAQKVLDELPFRDVISWNAIIIGYAYQGRSDLAFTSFEQMQCEGLHPDVVTLICLLKACGNMRAGHKGKQIHDEIISQGLLKRNLVLGNALVDMYAKCGALVTAAQVLDGLPCRDVVSWSALITGYARQDQGKNALLCYERMLGDGLSPNAVTLICLLKACSSIGASDKGKQIHDEIVSQGLVGKDIVLSTALVDMYARCGMLTKAQQVLDEFSVRDVVSWNSIIAGYAQYGQEEEVSKCFEHMQQEGLFPDCVTFICMLNACSRSGLLSEGQMFLENMSDTYCLTPSIEHYSCMVDLFGRTGNLGKASAMIKKMPSSDGISVWETFLGACQKWGNVQMGEWAFEHAIYTDTNGLASYLCAAVDLHYDLYGTGRVQ